MAVRGSAVARRGERRPWVPALIWLGFWYWSNNVARQNYLGAQIGMETNGVEPTPWHGGAVNLR